MRVHVRTKKKYIYTHVCVRVFLGAYIWW